MGIYLQSDSSGLEQAFVDMKYDEIMSCTVQYSLVYLYILKSNLQTHNF